MLDFHPAGTRDRGLLLRECPGKGCRSVASIYAKWNSHARPSGPSTAAFCMGGLVRYRPLDLGLAGTEPAAY